MGTTNIVNPGLVNVADQADGPTSVDQAVTSTRPCTDAGPLVQAASLAPGLGLPTPPPTSPPMTAQRTVDGGEFSPQDPNVADVALNNVAGQVYGTGTPTDVFV